MMYTDTICNLTFDLFFFEEIVCFSLFFFGVCFTIHCFTSTPPLAIPESLETRFGTFFAKVRFTPGATIASTAWHQSAASPMVMPKLSLVTFGLQRDLGKEDRDGSKG